MAFLDESHRYLEEELAGFSDRLDAFFGDDRRLELDRPGTYVRWRNELRIDDRGRLAARTSARASLELPSLTRWLARARLVIAGESTPDPAGHATEEAGSPGFSPTVRTEQASTELRADLFREPGSLIQAATGLRLHWTWPPEVLVRLRFHQRLDLGAGVTARFMQEGLWTSVEGFGVKTHLDLDRSLGPHTGLRWASAGGIRDASRGYEWASELGLSHELPALQAGTTLAFSVVGHTYPAADVDLYRLFFRLRRELWRRWLFAELEPAVEWPLDPAPTRIRLHTITFRLEIQLDGRSAPGPADKG